MKFNKWTLGLATVGAISMASAVRADEAKLVPLETALSNTTISGYVDVGAQYNIGNYGPNAGVPAGTAGNLGPGNKVDNFSLNDVDIALDKPQDESPWASGYHIDFNAGTDAVGVGANGTQPTSASGTASFAVRQAYIVLRTPIGNGIDWKAGIQDDIIGYEGNTDGANPNYTRSIGYFTEPTTLLGLVGSYKVIDSITVQAGIADATSPLLGAYGYDGSIASSSDKSAVAAIAFTAPDSFGWAKGATLNLGTVVNMDKGGQYNYYAGLTVPTPISALKVGAAFDWLSVNNSDLTFPGNAANFTPNAQNDTGWVLGLYASVQATDKLSFNVRGEYYDLQGADTYVPGNYWLTDGQGEEVTFTVQYNLWANVISRLEFRWDHADSGNAFANPSTALNGATTYGDANSFMVAANLIYTF